MSYCLMQIWRQSFCNLYVAGRSLTMTCWSRKAVSWIYSRWEGILPLHPDLKMLSLGSAHSGETFHYCTQTWRSCSQDLSLCLSLLHADLRGLAGVVIAESSVPPLLGLAAFAAQFKLIFHQLSMATCIKALQKWLLVRLSYNSSQSDFLNPYSY